MDKNTHAHIPLAVQNFLTSQTFSYLQNTTAREGICTSFEKVIVQNILHGRSISLCEAIQSMSRWQFVKAALPHVLHCTASMLREKLRQQHLSVHQYQRQTKSDVQMSCPPPLQFSQAETKLLYTLHWILLDASSECEDAEMESARYKHSHNRSSGSQFLHDLASLQLFVYLFAPLIEQLKVSDFETLKLEPGLAIWIPLLNHRQPASGPMSAPVKRFDFTKSLLISSRRHVDQPHGSANLVANLGQSDIKTLVKKVGGIYVGEDKQSHKRSHTNEQDIDKPNNVFQDHQKIIEEIDSLTPTSVSSEATTKTAKHLDRKGRTKGTAPPKATPEVTEELDGSGESSNSFKMNSNNEPKESSVSGYQRIVQMLDHETEMYLSESQSISSAFPDTAYHLSGTACALATHLDLAVIRCLFSTEWSECGVYWSLVYLYKRLLQIRIEKRQVEQETLKWFRLTQASTNWQQFLCPPHSSTCGHMKFIGSVRSLSLPDMPMLGVRTGTNLDKCRQSNIGKAESSGDHKSNTSRPILDSSNSNPALKSTFFLRKPRSFIDSKTLLSPATEDTGSALKVIHNYVESNVPIDVGTRETTTGNPNLALTLPLVTLGVSSLGSGLSPGLQVSWRAAKRSRIADIKERFTRASKAKSGEQNGVDGTITKSDVDHPNSSDHISKSTIATRSRSDGVGLRSQSSVETSPTDVRLEQERRQSTVLLKSSTKNSPDHPDAPSFTESDSRVISPMGRVSKSFSDSEITYHSKDKVEEVPGAVHYITENGQLDISVLLKALYWCSTVPTSTRVSFYLIRCLCVLFDCGILGTNANGVHHLMQVKTSDHKRTRIVGRKCSKIMSKCLDRESKPASHGKRQRKQSTIAPSCKKHENTPQTTRRVKKHSSILYLESDESDGQIETDSAHRSEEFTNNIKFCAGPGIRKQARGIAKNSSASTHRLSTVDVKHHSTSPAERNHASNQFAFGSSFCTKCRNNKEPMNTWQHPEQPTLCVETIKSNHVFAVEIAFRIIRSLGCIYGHRGSPMFGSRDISNETTRDRSTTEVDQTRRLTQDCLIHLYESNRRLFVRVMSRMMATMCVTDIVELYHALTGFCLDPASQIQNRSTKSPDTANYGNSFGQTSLKHTTREAEDIIVSCSLGPFIRRLVRSRAELVSQENLSLFGDLRQLFNYLREVHGSTFRRNMLVAMMCPIFRACERPGPKPPISWPRMSMRTSTWLLPRQEKRRLSSMFSENYTDTDVILGSLRGQRYTSWHTLLPRASMVNRTSRLNSPVITSSSNEKDSAQTRSDGESVGTQLIEHRWVSTPALKEGLADFAFLMECCEPGTIPEPQLIAALLDLEAPVIARACLLLECANLVHRCNRGEWAIWMKFNLPGSFQPGVLNWNSNKSMSTNHGMNAAAKESSIPDMLIVKQNAGRLFHAWGKALGSRLRHFIDLMHAESPVTRKKCHSNPQQGVDCSNRPFSILENDENFLDDASVNPSGECCPYALLSIAVQLLQEITTYLREMHQRVSQTIFNEQSNQATSLHEQQTSAKRRTSRDNSQERSTPVAKASSSIGPRASFKAARRRLSILMPILGSGGSLNTDAPDAESESKPTSGTDSQNVGGRNMLSRRISFAVLGDNRDRRGSFRGSITSLDHSPESDNTPASRSLLRHRGSGSFKGRKLYGKEPVNESKKTNRSGSGDSAIHSQICPKEPSASQLSDENQMDGQQSDQEAGQNQSLFASLTASQTTLIGQRSARPMSQTPASRSRENVSLHGVVRRSVSTAVALRRQRNSSVISPGIGTMNQEIESIDSCSVNMPWIDVVIDFLNYTTFSCDHQSYCLSNCFERQQHQCHALMNAITQVYGTDTVRSFIQSVDHQLYAQRGGDSSTRLRKTSEHEKLLADSGSEKSDSPHDTDSSASSVRTEELTESTSKRRSTMFKSRSTFHSMPSRESLDGTSRNSDTEADLSPAQLHRVGSAFVSENHKQKSARFSKPLKRKKAQFTGMGARRESASFLDRLRFRPANRSTMSGSSDTEAPGLTGLLGLGVLAGAGAGLLRNSSSNSGLPGSYMGDDDVAPMLKNRNLRAIGSNSVPELPIQRYIKQKVKNLYTGSFNLLNKAALLLNQNQLSRVISLAWELLLEPEEELQSSAACFLLFCGVRAPSMVQELIHSEMQHESADQRLNAILRFRAIWTHRYHVWSRLDEGAANQLRLPPPFTEFVLPSPTLGHPGFEAPDPVWQIRIGTSAEEVQLKQNEATKTFVTASTSRRKQQQEMLVRAIAAETLRRQEARRKFHLTTCPILDRAAVEPAFNKEHRDEGLTEEGNANTGALSVAPSPNMGGGLTTNSVQEEFTAAVRRLSVAPINRNVMNQTRNSSWRQGSIPWFRNSNYANDDEDRGCGGSHLSIPTQPLQQAQCIFPSALCAATVPLIHLLDDTSVSSQGLSVNTIAEFCVFQCLLQDTTLFLRFIFERLTRTQHKDELIFVLRKMIQRLPELPMQSAHAIFNNLVGYIMFHIRTPSSGAPEAIASALTVLHLVVPHVQNIFFKDLKQTMRREQIDSTLLLTANLPSAKLFNVFDNDIGVAQLVRLPDENKDYQFEDILKDVLECSGILIDQMDSYFLFDERSNVIRNKSHYVRDFYPFKRNHNPKLRLRHLNVKDGLYLLQQNAVYLKLQEICKVLFTTAVLQNTPNSQLSNHVFFLHEELTKLPSFPRKALECEFGLYSFSKLGRPLMGLDTAHKLSWCQLLSNMFVSMPLTYPWSSDLQLFLNVYNGTLILNAEDSSAVRQCLAFYIQCCYQFKTAFSTSGYAGILPTLIRVYNQQAHNAVLTQAVEFTCRQFFVMHRTPFVLQLFGCIANFVASGDENNGMNDNFYRIQPSTLYRLLRMMNRQVQDHLRILELCNIQKPLKALDFCYEDDEANWSILEAINLCVAVIVYAPDSYRSRQMLVILQAIVPFILHDIGIICVEENCGIEPKKAELAAIQKISISIRQLISTTEFMTRRIGESRPLNTHPPGGPTDRKLGKVKEPEPDILTKWTGIISRDTPTDGRLMGDTTDAGANEKSLQAVPAGRLVCDPREAILQLSCEFLSACSARLAEMGERQKIPELFDSKSHLRLSELVQSMIKQLPNNPNLLTKPALQRYFLEILPLVEWGHESMRSCKALETLLNRLNRTLSKLLHRSSPRLRFHWDNIVKLIHSVYLVIKKNRSIAHLKEIRVLLETLKRAVIFDPAGCLPALSKSQLEAVHSGRSTHPGLQIRPSLGDTHLNTPEVSSSNLSGVSRIANVSTGKVRLQNTNDHGTRLFQSQRHQSQGNSSSLLEVQHSPTTCETQASFKFAAEVIRLIALVLQVLGSNFCLKDLCERSGPDYSSRCPTLLEGGFHTLAVYLGQLIIPLLFRCSAGRKDSPVLSKENVFYALDVCITALFAPSTAKNKSGIMLDPLLNLSPDKSRDKAAKYSTDPNTPIMLSLKPLVMEYGITSGSLKPNHPSYLITEQDSDLNYYLIRLLSPTIGGTQVSSNLSVMPQINSVSALGARTEVMSAKSRTSVASVSMQKGRTHSSHSRHMDSGSSHTSLLEDKPKNFKSEFAHRLGFLGLKLLMVAFPRHAAVRLRLIASALTKLALNGQNRTQLWKFFDFLVTHRPPVFVHLLPFIRFKMAYLCCTTPGEQAYQQIVNQKLIGLHLPVPQTTAAVLRELMAELNAIQHDAQHFSRTRTREQHTSHAQGSQEPAKYTLSADHSNSGTFRKQSARKTKTILEELTEENSQTEAEPVKQATGDSHVDILASVSSESACSQDQQEDMDIGLPSLSRPTRGTRSMMQGFRQSLLRRNLRKRISAQGGSRILTQNQGVKQKDPILSASAESLHRKSQTVSRRKERNNQPEGNMTHHILTYRVTGQKKQFNERLADDASDSFDSDDFGISAAPAAAAAVASSLYGSTAPYVHAREKARQELAALVGIQTTASDRNSDIQEPGVLDFLFADQENGIVASPYEQNETNRTRSQTVPTLSSQIQVAQHTKAETSTRTSKIDYV